MLDLDDEVLEIARQWVVKAENDLKNAAHTVKLKTDCPTDTVCFHVHQCVEKYLKALLVLNSIDFSRTHQISTLLALVPAQVRPRLTQEEQDRLTEYAVTTRYRATTIPSCVRKRKRLSGSRVVSATRCAGASPKPFLSDLVSAQCTTLVMTATMTHTLTCSGLHGIFRGAARLSAVMGCAILRGTAG